MVRDSQHNRASILVVDDNADNLNLLTNLLRYAGYTVRAALTPVLALQSALEHPPNLVLLDIRMPEMDGFEVCQRLKQDAHTSDIPVIFISGQDDVGDRLHSFEVGGVDFIGKPIQREEVLARVHTHLELSRKTHALKKSESRLNFLLSSSPVVIYTCSATPPYAATYVSPNIKELMGYEPEQFTGNGDFWADNIHPEDRERVFKDLSKIFTQNIYHHEYRFRHDDNSFIWMHDELTLIRDNDGEPVEMIGYWADITERKKIEHELILAKEAAEAANMAKNTFLSHMSHELRTPLNAILGYAQILQNDPQISKQNREKIAIIRRSGNNLLAHISDILDLAKIEANKIELNPATLNLENFVGYVCNYFRAQTERKGIELVCNFSDGPCTSIKADEKRLQQILLNLISNAVKFTQKGKVVVQITVNETSPSIAGNCLLRCSVEDTGPGIPKDDITKIFKPFVQLPHEKQNSEGTGLGLNIAQQLIALMGGQLKVESETGKGSRFWFELELPKAETQEQRPDNSAQIPVGYRGARRKILVVDDIKDNRLLLKDFLESLGFQVVLASRGIDVLTMTRDMQPDLIMLDLFMPGISGYQSLVTLRKIPDHQNIPVIAMSASVNEETHALEAGFNGFSPKPMVAEQLIQMLGDLLHLDWVFATDTNHKESLMTYPSAEQLAPLREWIRLGKMPQIIRWAETLRSTAPEYSAFAQQVIKLAREVDEEGLQAFINNNTNNSTPLMC